MSKKVIATLHWIGPKEGGRPIPPPGPNYSTVARFEVQKEQWLKDAWSLVITFIEQPDESRSHRVEATFLAEKGPDHLLSKGNTFELMEGARRVAKGTILSEYVASVAASVRAPREAIRSSPDLRFIVSGRKNGLVQIDSGRASQFGI